VKSSNVGANDLSTLSPSSAPPIHPPTNSSSVPSNPATLEDGRFAFQNAPEFNEILEKLKVSKGPQKNESRKCYHWRQNKKPTQIRRQDNETASIECGCSENKAVCEFLLVKMGILGKDVGNDVELRSLTEAEWYKADHIMGAIFGFNTS
jgi:hypothetical protein